MSYTIELFAPEFKLVANQVADAIHAQYKVSLKSSKRLEVLAKLFGFNSYNGYLANQNETLTLISERDCDALSALLAKQHQTPMLTLYPIMRDYIEQPITVIEQTHTGQVTVYSATRAELCEHASRIETWAREVHTQASIIEDYGNDSDDWPDWANEALAEFDTKPFVVTWRDSDPVAEGLDVADSELDYAVEALGHNLHNFILCRSEGELDEVYRTFNNNPEIQNAIIEYSDKNEITLPILMNEWVAKLEAAGYEAFYTDFRTGKPCVIMDDTIELIDARNIAYLLEHVDDAGVTYSETYSGLVHERFEVIVEEEAINVENEQHLVSAIMSLDECIEQLFEQEFLIKTDRYYSWTSSLTQCDGDKDSFIYAYKKFEKDMNRRYGVTEQTLEALDCTLDVAIEAFDKHYA